MSKGMTTRGWFAAMLLVASGATCAKGVPLPAPTVQVMIPAGTFMLGRTLSETDDCKGADGVCAAGHVPHPVTLTKPFLIDRTEVTNLQYASFVAFHDDCEVGDLDGAYPSHPEQPAEVPISNARAYCESRQMRLPTAAEWEVAARMDMAGTLRRYPWGEAPLPDCTLLPSNSPGCSTGNQSLYDVGTKAIDATPRGVFDMAGNAREWVDDDYSAVQDCIFGLPLQTICPNDEASCRQTYCSSPAACNASAACSNAGCGSSGSLPLCASSTEPAIDPYYVGGSRGSIACNSTPNGNTFTAKGGGAYHPNCAQDPALKFAVGSTAGDPGPGRNGGNPPLGFRCVTGPAPAARATVSVSFNDNGQLCRAGRGAIRIAKNTPTPAGWGSANETGIQLWLATSLDAIRATPDGVGGYLLDWSAICPRLFNQSLSGALIATNAPRESFTIEVTASAGTTCLSGTAMFNHGGGICGNGQGGGFNLMPSTSCVPLDMTLPMPL